jgi:hypothetical protein
MLAGFIDLFSLCLLIALKSRRIQPEIGQHLVGNPGHGRVPVESSRRLDAELVRDELSKACEVPSETIIFTCRCRFGTQPQETFNMARLWGFDQLVLTRLVIVLGARPRPASTMAGSGALGAAGDDARAEGNGARPFLTRS